MSDVGMRTRTRITAALVLAFALVGLPVLPTTGLASTPAGACQISPLSNGSIGSTAVVPAGFDPLHASDAELACYAFPPRPSNPEDLGRWEQAMSNAKHYVVPETQPDQRFVSLRPASLTSSGTASPNTLIQTNVNQTYAGYRVPTSQPVGESDWYGTDMQWVQPRDTFTGQNQVWGTWDAIGDGAFPQAGVYDGQGLSQPLFFWECAKYADAVPVTNLSAPLRGDTVLVDTEVGSFGGGNTMRFYFENEQNQSYTNLDESCGTYSTSTGTAWFSREVNQNLGTYGWGTFTSFQISDATALSQQRYGYIDSYSYIKDVIAYGSTTIASPSTPSYPGTYTMCNC